MRRPPPATDERANAVGQADEHTRDGVAREREGDLEEKAREERGVQDRPERRRAGVKQRLEVLLENEGRRREERERQPGCGRAVGRPRPGRPTGEPEDHRDRRQAGDQGHEVGVASGAEDERAGVPVGRAEDEIRRGVRGFATSAPGAIYFANFAAPTEAQMAPGGSASPLR